MKTKDLTISRSFLTCLVAVLGMSTSCTRDVTSQSRAKFVQGDAKYKATTAEGSPIQVVLRSAELSSASPYSPSDFWGEVRDFASVWIITKLDVMLKGKSVIVPMSAYSDLANVKTLTVVTKPEGFELEIHGGETASGYQARLIFDSGGVLKKRRVESAVFADEAWQETTYSFIPDDGR